MGLDTYVRGVRDLDKGKFDKMMKLKLACEEVDAEYPKELREYFDGYAGESEKYLRKTMEEFEIDVHNYSESGSTIWEVELDDLPEDVTAIRFYNSW